MQLKRSTYLFQSTRGLVLLAITMIAIVTVLFGTLSGPMKEWGVTDLVTDLTGLKLVPAEREGRIVILYHAISMAVVAINTYFITGNLALRDQQRKLINGIITAGYLTSMIFGLSFVYFGHNWILHGLWLFGLSLMFFAGILLTIVLWPWKKEYRVLDPAYSRTKSGVDLERVAFFTMAVATLGSALFGAITGSYWGNGHETFLAEDLIREPHKTLLQLSIIGHLHIMLTLIGISITLIIGRWFNFKGQLHKLAMPMMIFGTIVITVGAWSVILTEAAHYIIYLGSVLVMLAALLLVIFAWDKLIRGGVAENGLEKGNVFQKIGALLRDPLRFGSTWQMVFMNFTVSGVGIFTAVKLDEIFRVWPARDERIILTGHWHVLSGIIATIILFYYAALVGLKGRARKLFGWVVIIFSDIAFAAATVFELKRLFVSEAEQQPLVNTTMLLMDIGLGVVLLALAIFLIWRWLDWLKKDGQWKEELVEEGFDKLKEIEELSIPLKVTIQPDVEVRR
ncbi:MAG: hypothetical protein GTO18_06025 [Anaerolineales bacterium]|nr:hypothetical protein [Anaerolineales bacterium]